MKKILFVLLVCMNMATFAKGKENLEFQCTLKNGAEVTAHSTQSDYIYRYIKNGKVDLKIKQNKKLVEKNSKANRLEKAFNLVFVNGDYMYQIYSSIIVPENPNESSAGIYVMSNNESDDLQILPCRKLKVSNLN